MGSPFAERATEDSFRAGKALLKFISPNDVGITGSHQCGFYLPKGAWALFTPFPPEKGRNDKSDVTITWQDGLVTESVVTWYGKETRSEYRLTSFGRDFPWLTGDLVGALLVLIPASLQEFRGYVLDREEDIEEIQAALGVQVIERWAVFEAAAPPPVESADDCVDRRFREFAAKITAFPPGAAFSAEAQAVLVDCIADFLRRTPDEQLLELVKEEYRLFRLIERKVCAPDITRLFRDIEDFLETARSILNRRMSRAGRSLENHVEFLLTQARVPFEMRPAIQGEPDVIIPSKAAYDDPSFPTDRLVMVAVKTTCKDRWRQVTREAPRIASKHILTLQEGISSSQLGLMAQENVTLIVPKGLQKMYPDEHQITILEVGAFLASLQHQFAA